MAIVDVVETGHARVADLRTELGRVRGALDRTDAVLGATDDALDKAETAIRTGRRWAPIVLVVGTGLMVVGVAATVALIRRRRRSQRSAD